MKDIWDSLKGSPIWMFVAAAIVALLLWQNKTLNTAVPADYRAYIPLVAVAIMVFMLARIAGTIASSASSRRERRRELARMRLTKLYRPMLTLFNEQHMTTCSSSLAPYVKDRVRNAWKALRRRRGGLQKMLIAWQALGDRQISTSAEMEYGSTFPLSQIKTLVRASPDCADGKLLNLVRQADRSHYEDHPQYCEVTDAEYVLAEHIFAEHERLSALSERW